MVLDRLNLLKRYLGSFMEKPSLGVREALRPRDLFGHLLIVSKDVNQVITFLLLKEGRQNYRVLSSTQIIDIFLGKEEEISSYRSITDPIAIVTVSKSEMENKRRWELVYQFGFERKHAGLGAIIITNEFPPNMQDFRDANFDVVLTRGVDVKSPTRDDF